MIRRVGDHEAYSALRASELGDRPLEVGRAGERAAPLFTALEMSRRWNARAARGGGRDGVHRTDGRRPRLAPHHEQVQPPSLPLASRVPSCPHLRSRRRAQRSPPCPRRAPAPLRQGASSPTRSPASMTAARTPSHSRPSSPPARRRACPSSPTEVHSTRHACGGGRGGAESRGPSGRHGQRRAAEGRGELGGSRGRSSCLHTCTWPTCTCSRSNAVERLSRQAKSENGEK